MNVYDFDETIYHGDSTRDFYFFCVRRHPRVLLYLPMQGFYFALFALRCIDKTAFKQRFYRFFRALPDTEQLLTGFWDSHIQHIKAWYHAAQQPDDLIISASPEFLLRPACDRLGISHLIASRVDSATGKYDGENCYGAEKVRRMYALYPSAHIDAFYSDSESDRPLAELAERAFLVQGEALLPWSLRS